ncbi:hypothetical protein SKAU_G00409080 [Synaphobranchus kaupii]|uniref:Uncharacterized protein n=1 Tax=Synaphobranchus kaupii TaxID=118154 RepID=A0A9Q1EAL9_SYNKA|nr:hypothetical protein SKAU_G00409080 [Synaphobranchus kaupii]
MQRALVWVWGSVQCLLLQCLVHVSASYEFAHVGHKAVLPCNWTSRIGTAQRPTSLYLWWETPDESVFELGGSNTGSSLPFEAPDYKGRVEVKLQSFEEGDCSLLLRDVQFSDARLYESYVSKGKGRRFIRSVELSVRDHKYRETVAAGKSLQLKLHTTQAATVVFWGNELEDSGTYKVLDPQGLAVSTVHLTVEEVLPKQSVPENTVDQRYMEDARDGQSSAFRASGPYLITGFLLLFSLHVLF